MKLSLQEIITREAILDTLPLGVTIQDKKGKLVYANTAAASLMGLKDASSVVKKGIKIRNQFLIYDDRGKLITPEKLPGRVALVTKKKQEAILRFTKNDQEQEFWSKVTAVPIADKGVMNIIQDYTAYTKEKQAYQLLIEQENALQLALDVGSMGIWDWDISRDIFTWSDGLRPVFGTHHGNKKGVFADFLKHVYPQDRRKTKKKFLLSRNTLQPYEDEFRVTWPDGSVHWMYKKGQVLPSQNGKAVRIVGVGMDITKRKQEERIIYTSEKKFKAIFNTAVDAMIICDSSMHVHEANKSALKLFSIHAMKSDRTLLSKFITDDAKKKFSATWKNFLQVGTVRSEINIQSKKGVRTLEYSGKAEFLPGFHLLIFRDITERIEEAARREHLLGLSSHELRTPLASIKAFVELMKRNIARGNLAKTAQYLSKIDEKTDEVTRLVTDLLDIARIRENRLDFFYEHFDGDVFISEIVHDLQLTIPTHNIYIKGKAKTSFLADKQRMSQVLTNLIKNAVRYSPDADKVFVTVTKKIRSVIICVSDEGIGIAPQDQKKIFQLFYKADIQSRQRVFGIGVGLYIAKTIVEGHGGKIWVESNVQNGSKFFISLPLKKEHL